MPMSSCKKRNRCRCSWDSTFPPELCECYVSLGWSDLTVKERFMVGGALLLLYGLATIPLWWKYVIQ